MEANALPGADYITVPQGTYSLTIGGANEDAAATGDLDITDDLDILGADERSTIIDGGGLDRVFEIFGPTVVGVSGLTLWSTRGRSQQTLRAGS